MSETKPKSFFEQLILTPSDINEHLPTLYRYGRKCSHITEFGIRGGASTYAFMEAKPEKVIGYDILWWEEMRDLLKYSIGKTDLQFQIKSTLSPGLQIEQTDLLFIDTLHTYNQLKQELEQHHSKVNKYIIFHDVVTFGLKDEELYAHADKKHLKKENKQGLMPAILDFILENDEWNLEEYYYNNNGLLILEKW